MPGRRAAGPGGPTAGPRHGRHRAREHVLVGGVPRQGAQAGHQADPRVRGVRRDREPLRQGRRHRRDVQPPRAAGGDPRRVPEPHQARVGGLHGGVPLPAAHRPGAARAALGGPDRPQQLPQGRDSRAPARRAGTAGDRGRRLLPGHARAGQLLPRDAVPGHRGTEGRQRGTPAGGQGHQPAARVHERRALPAPGGLQGARHPAVHRQGEDGQRRPAHALPRRSVLPEDAGGDGAGLRRLPGSDGEHRSHRRAVRRGPGEDRPPAAELRRAGAVRPRRVLREDGVGGVRPPVAAPPLDGGRRPPASHDRRVPRSASRTRSR